MPSGDFPGASKSPEGAGFRKIGERGRFKGGFFEVVSARLIGPDGYTFEREIIHHPGAVCVVPLEADGRHVLMIRQYRAAVGRALLELPAGKRDVPEEDPALCASRELVEEIGREASSFVEVAQFYNSPGISDELTICFLATELRECARDAHGVEEENLTVERVVLEDVEELVAAGDLVDAKSIIALAAARTALGWTVRPPAPAASTGVAAPPSEGGRTAPPGDEPAPPPAGHQLPPTAGHLLSPTAGQSQSPAAGHRLSPTDTQPMPSEPAHEWPAQEGASGQPGPVASEASPAPAPAPAPPEEAGRAQSGSPGRRR